MNIRSRPQGYFLTILQENDGYFVGRDVGLLSSSRRHLNLGSTIKGIREEMKKVKLLEGEHLWLGYQPRDNMPSVYEAWVQIYGKRIQYRKRTRESSTCEGFDFNGICRDSLFPFVYSNHSYSIDVSRCGYNFARDVIARKFLSVDKKRHLCSLCDCSGKSHEDSQDAIKSDNKNVFQRCDFSIESGDGSWSASIWEERVKENFPFGVVCYKWGVNEKVIFYVKTNLW